ncbi:hypothetical protein KVR01_007836 [Diaporthe batatas]|uniref:uncharacterized protein n=1 Tax=Diaporthe batatas TaxID=748121 RepID=UPI001D03877E|nr:uncharacterized protein KVR01_007836 [Diaporthe batatas]KAG8162071.1 hypothetical protein KVR01_007836 [Diaporthe batatas]
MDVFQLEEIQIPGSLKGMTSQRGSKCQLRDCNPRVTQLRYLRECAATGQATFSTAITGPWSSSTRRSEAVPPLTMHQCHINHLIRYSSMLCRRGVPNTFLWSLLLPDQGQ